MRPSRDRRLPLVLGILSSSVQLLSSNKMTAHDREAVIQSRICSWRWRCRIRGWTLFEHDCEVPPISAQVRSWRQSSTGLDQVYSPGCTGELLPTAVGSGYYLLWNVATLCPLAVCRPGIGWLPQFPLTWRRHSSSYLSKAWLVPLRDSAGIWKESEGEVAQLCPTLCDPMDCSLHQAPPSMGFSRQEYWSGLPFPSLGGRNLELPPISLVPI